jgi:multidrug efflux pump subunit AcrB
LQPAIGGDLAQRDLRGPGGEDVIGRVRLAEADRMDPQSLRSMIVLNAEGMPYDLGQLIDVEERPVQAEIRRRNQQYQRGITFDFRGPRRIGNRYLRSLIDGTQLPPGYEIEDDQGILLSSRDERNISYALALALLLVYMAAAALFESFVLPFVALLSVPMSFSGVVALFWALDESFDRTAYIGLILLAGIAINNALLLVHRAGALLRRGCPPFIAARRASSERLRPILMATATSVAGLLPLALAGEGGAADEWRALALAAAAGLSASAFFTLFLIPTLFVLLTRPQRALLPRSLSRSQVVVSSEAT